MTNRSKTAGWLRRLSLKGRLTALLSALVLVVILFAAFLLFQQHQLARQGAEFGIEAQQEMIRTTQMRESLNEIDRYAAFGEVNTREIARFRDLMNSLGVTPQTALMRERLENYVH